MIAITGFYAFCYQGESNWWQLPQCVIYLSSIFLPCLYDRPDWFIYLPMLPTLFICLVVFPSYTSSCTYMYDCNHIFVKVIFFSDYIHLLMRFLCQHSTLSTQAVGNRNVFSGLALLFGHSRLGQVYLWTEIGWFFMITFHFWYSIRASIPIRCMLLCLALQISMHSYLMFLWLPSLGFIPFVLLLLHVVA